MQQIKSVRVQDFQSLRDVDLELGRFSVIVGHSNAGKSAIIRALQASLFNWTGGAFVREGADEAQVEITFERAGPAGNVLTWRKPRKGGAHYFVGTTEISRVGKEMPPEIAELTGIRETEFEGGSAKLQVDSQFDPVFMLAGTGGQAARLLARVAKVDVLVSAQIHARKDMQAKRQAADKAVEDADACVAQLAALPDYDALLAAWGELDGRLKVATARADGVRKCASMASELEGLNRMIVAVRTADLGSRVEAVREKATALSERARLIANAVTARDVARDALSRVAVAKSAARTADRDLHKVMGELDVCPICQRPMKEA